MVIFMQQEIEHKWLDTITSSLLFFALAIGIYALATKGVIAKVIIIAIPQSITFNPLFIKETIIFAPTAIDMIIWSTAMLFLFFKSFKYLTLPLFAFLFGLDELFWELCYYTSKSNYTLDLHYFIQLGIEKGLPLGLSAFIIGYIALKPKINLTFRYEHLSKIILFMYIPFAILYILAGVPIINNPFTGINTLSNWTWQEGYNILMLSMMCLIIKRKPIKSQT
jgi:hypothetical protein